MQYSRDRDRYDEDTVGEYEYGWCLELTSSQHTLPLVSESPFPPFQVPASPTLPWESKGKPAAISAAATGACLLYAVLDTLLAMLTRGTKASSVLQNMTWLVEEPQLG